MKRMQKLIALMLLSLAIISIGCKKAENHSHNVVLELTTISPYDITQTSAVCGCRVTVSENVSLAELGVCWGQESNLTVESAHLFTTSWNEPFTCSLDGLEPNTKYYVRAYALQGVTYFYGDEKSFTTDSNGGGGGGGADDGYTYVDLGLPSGLLWAECNVGAINPEDYGSYFAWGETQPKDFYDWSTYIYGSGENMLTKYCTNSEYGLDGFVDSLFTLQPEDDAATVVWGEGWRTPTQDEWSELTDNTTSEWTTENGVNGRRYTASNGNSIFLPAAGRCWSDGLSEVGNYGTYWSSSLFSYSPDKVIHFNFYSEWGLMSFGARYIGLTVRPVRSAR